MKNQNQTRLSIYDDGISILLISQPQLAMCTVEALVKLNRLDKLQTEPLI